MSQDTGYRLLFSHPRMVADLLASFLPPTWSAALDLDTLEPLNTDFLSDTLRQRRADCLWRVRWGPAWLYVVIHIEFQSSEDTHMALRVSTYLTLLYQDLVRTGRIPAGALLPAVLPIVLYNGESPWRAPTDLVELIESPPVGLELFQPRIRYLLIDEGRYSDADLASRERNLVAALFRLEKGWPPTVLMEVLTLLAEWLQAPEQRELQRAFVTWLRQVWSQPRMQALAGLDWAAANNLLEVRGMLAERINEWTEQLLKQGREEGREEVREEVREEMLAAERNLLIRLAHRRFGADCAEQLGRLLSGIDDQALLTRIGEMVVERDEAEDFLSGVEALLR